MAEITKSGATGTTLSEYLDVMRQRYLDIDDGWNIAPESPDGLAIAGWCETLANLDEGVVNTYHSADPNSAIGQQLDRIAMFAGIRRHQASFSTDRVIFKGDGNKTLPAGTLVRHRVTGTLWATDQQVSTDAQGDAQVGVTCTTAGEQSANAGTLTVIATPVSGIRTVNNPDAASLGLAEENDDSFRVRRNESVALPGNNQVDNIYAALYNVSDVKQVKIYENEESAPDEFGIFGHSMAIFVDGGTPAGIAAAIAARKNPGCGLNRTNTIPNKLIVNTFTPKGQPATVTLFRPEYVSIFVRVEIATDTLTDEDDDKIKQAIVDYSIMGFDQTNGFAKQGFRIGEKVSAGRLFTPTNYFVAGDDFVASIAIGTSADNVTLSVIAVSYNQLGTFDKENIEVIHV